MGWAARAKRVAVRLTPCVECERPLSDDERRPLKATTDGTVFEWLCPACEKRQIAEGYLWLNRQLTP